MKKALKTITTAIIFLSLTGCTQEQILREAEPEVIEQQIEIEEQIEEQIEEIDNYWQNGVYTYYYNQLTSEQQNIYNQSYETVLNMKESTEIKIGSSSLTQEDISIIFRALRYDHTEIYWIQGYKYIIDGNSLYFYPTYIVNTEEKELYDNQLKTWTETALASIDSNMTDFEKELEIYDFLVTTTKYSLDADMNQSLISVVKGETVCLGYTKAMKYLCDRSGLGCVVVEGISKEGVAHSWNKIKINEKWYNIDVTNSNTAQIFSDSYDMFNITDELISNRYIEITIGSNSDLGEKSGSGSITFEYPVADSIEADYYNMKGLYINSLEEIETIVSNHIEDGTVTIRIGDNCDMLKDYMRNIKFRDSDGNIINVKSLSYVNINHIRLLEINWSR